jgi:hypothetical protein
MIHVGSLYEACSALFASYPLAADNCGSPARSMVMMLRHDDAIQFFVLANHSGEGRPIFSIRPWRASGIVNIEEGGGAYPEVVVNAVTRGVPIPRHGSLFGWRTGDVITALIAIYVDYVPSSPQPSWAVMPLVGVSEAQWPPFTDEPFFGQWFWEHYRAGSVVSLDSLIAGVPGTVFWAETEAVLGWDCCAVAHDVESQAGYTLRHGRYAYYQALRMGKPVPSLGVMLADDGKTDLAPLFRLCVRCDS